MQIVSIFVGKWRIHVACVKTVDLLTALNENAQINDSTV